MPTYKCRGRVVGKRSGHDYLLTDNKSFTISTYFPICLSFAYRRKSEKILFILFPQTGRCLKLHRSNNRLIRNKINDRMTMEEVSFDRARSQKLTLTCTPKLAKFVLFVISWFGGYMYYTLSLANDFLQQPTSNILVMLDKMVPRN